MIGFFIFKYMKTLINDLKFHLEAAKNSSDALQMKAYMKDHFDFFGIRAPERKNIQKPWISEIQKSLSTNDKWSLILALWKFKEREYQLVAMDLLNGFKKQEWTKEDISRFEYLLTTKSWWDSVDTIASNSLGVYFKQFPEQQKIITKKWSNSGNIWLMRSTIIFQLKYKNTTDFELLSDLIRKYQSKNEFFIQKAIGWSLRQYSKFNAEAVRDFIYDTKLSGLAKREASIYLGRFS